MKVRQLSTALRKIAEDEVNEHPMRMEFHIESLREWMQEQPHLRSIKPTDQWLVAILRGSKYDQQKARGKLESYYNLRRSAPEFYANRDPMDPKIQELLKLGLFLPIRKCARDDSPRTCIVRVGAICKSPFGLVDLMKISFMITEILLLEDDQQTVVGSNIVPDMKDIGLNIIRQWTPSLARKTLTCTEKSLAIRLKNIHIINSPSSIMLGVAIFKMFLSSKVKKRVQVYDNNYEGMYESIPQEVLPYEYGGHDGSLQELADYWKIKVESYRDWFLEQDKALESVLNNLKSQDDQTNSLSNTDNSFKTLEID